MSAENVELVRRLQPAPEADLVELFHKDWDSVMGRIGRWFHPDLQVVMHMLGEGGSTGLEGLRQTWLATLEPWTSYRTEIDELIDAGDSVVVLVRDYARHAQTDAELSLYGSAVWTVRDGQVVRIEFFDTRERALQAAGLADG